MWDDDDLGAALRTELAQRPLPSRRGGLADAVTRGRRRRQQFGVALVAVAAVVGVTGVVVGAQALPAGGQEIAATGTAPAEAPWPRAALPAQLYSLSVRNFGSPDFTANRDDPAHPNRVSPGRPTLPLTGFGDPR